MDLVGLSSPSPFPLVLIVELIEGKPGLPVVCQYLVTAGIKISHWKGEIFPKLRDQVYKSFLRLYVT